MKTNGMTALQTIIYYGNKLDRKKDNIYNVIKIIILAAFYETPITYFMFKNLFLLLFPTYTIISCIIFLLFIIFKEQIKNIISNLVNKYGLTKAEKFDLEIANKNQEEIYKECKKMCSKLMYNISVIKINNKKNESDNI